MTLTARQKLFDYMSKEHNCYLLESDIDQIQNILFPPDYPFMIDDTMLSKMTKHGLIKLKSKIAHQIRNL